MAKLEVFKRKMLSLGQFHTRTHARDTLIYMTHVKQKAPKGLYGQLVRLLPYILALLLWGALMLREQFFLKKVEDLSLFLFEWPFLRDTLLIPGGFLGYLGSFLTQFLHLPWLGSLIWILLLLISYQLTIKAFKIPARLHFLAIIPAMMLVIGNMDMGYKLFLMREQDHFFGPTLGYLAALIPVFAIKKTDRQWSKILLLTLWTPAAFELLGIYGLVGTVTAACILLGSNSLRKERITVLIYSIALFFIVPVLMYGLYTTFRMADSWSLGLPSISEDAFTASIRNPFRITLIYLPLMALAGLFIKNDDKSDLGAKQIGTSVAIYLFAVVVTWAFWFKDSNFHTELAMSNAVDRNAWQEVVDIYKKAVDSKSKSDAKAYEARTKALTGVRDTAGRQEIVDKYADLFFEPTRTMVMYRDLALLKLNRALDEAFTLKDGSRLQNREATVPMAFQSGKQLYMHYGLVNMSYRWCLEDVIEHGWSNATLKYMVIHSVVMHEEEFARKYINKLHKTIFYRRWANEQRELAHDSTLMAVTAPYSEILPYMCFENRMTNDMVLSESFIMRHFSEPEPEHATPEYDRAALFWAMRIQNIPAFWMHLYYYLQSNRVNELPRSVEEAAILYSHLEKGGLEIPYSKSVTDSYNAFQNYVKQHPPVNMKESAYPYSQKFGRTFFYYYYFMRDLQTY